MEREERGKQIALWAYKLAIEHPITKETLEFKDLPEPIGTWCILKNEQNMIEEYIVEMKKIRHIFLLKDNSAIFFIFLKLFYKISRKKFL